MRRTAAMLGALGLCLWAVHAAADGPGPDPGVNGAQMNQLRDYGTQLGESWVKDTFGLDLPGMAGGVQESLQETWDDEGWGDLNQGGAGSASQGGAAGLTQSAGAPSSKGFSVRVTQTDNLGRLDQGLRAVPFGVEMKDSFQIGPSSPTLRTRLSIPLSPNDAWRAEARMPVDLSSTADAWWWRGLGLGKNLSLRSEMSSRLGFNEVEAGMGADWRPGFWGVWDLDYAWQVRYGEGSGASVNWLKVSKRF